MEKTITLQDTNHLDTQTMQVNIGPQHPSTHGVFRMNCTLDGEVITKLTPVMGYLHRNHEQIAENMSYAASMPYTDRLDYFNSMLHNIVKLKSQDIIRKYMLKLIVDNSLKNLYKSVRAIEKT